MGKGGGGNKDAVEPAELSAPSSGGDTDLVGVMSTMMGMMGQLISNIPQTPQLPPIPEVYSEPPVDFGERQTALTNKARADYRNDLDRRKGRVQTILTSPLLDNEDPETTSSLLTSNKGNFKPTGTV